MHVSVSAVMFNRVNNAVKQAENGISSWKSGIYLFIFG